MIHETFFPQCGQVYTWFTAIYSMAKAMCQRIVTQVFCVLQCRYYITLHYNLMSSRMMFCVGIAGLGKGQGIMT